MMGPMLGFGEFFLSLALSLSAGEEKDSTITEFLPAEKTN